MPHQLSKNQKKRFRELAAIAYERELTTASEQLLADFVRWQEKHIDIFELNERIHEFHNGISRTLYGRYVGMDPQFGVARALRSSVLKRNEVEDDLFVMVEGMVELLTSSEFAN